MNDLLLRGFSIDWGRIEPDSYSCRVLREITEADRDFYYKDRSFDVEDY